MRMRYLSHVPCPFFRDLDLSNSNLLTFFFFFFFFFFSIFLTLFSSKVKPPTHRMVPYFNLLLLMGRNHAIFGGNWVLKTKQTNIKQCFGKAFCLSLSLSLSLHLFDLTIGFFDHFLFPPNCIGLSKLNPLLPKLKKARPDSLLIGNFEFIFIGFFFFFLSRLNASDYIPNLNYLLKFTPRY